MKKYRFVLIGCGRISQRHLAVLSGLQKAEIAAVCDIDEKKASAAAETYNVPHYTDFKEMLSKERPDVASVLVPSGLHSEIAIQCVDMVKNIIVEKPMALKLEAADDLIQACLKKNAKLFVVKQNRFNLPVQKLKEALDDNRFGKLVLITTRVRWCRKQDYYDRDSWRGTWEMDGGVLTNQASHHIDLIQWLGGPVESVIAKTATRLVDIETEDTGIALLKFTNGALGIIEATTAARPSDLEGSISVLGEKGSVEIEGFAVNKIRHWHFTEKLTVDDIVKEKYSENPPDVYGFGHKEYLKQVIDNLDGKSESPVDSIEGRKSLELINAIYESAETGKEVFLKFKPVFCRLGEKS